MDVEEAERVVVAKPVASRPTCSTFGSFSEVLADAIDASPSLVSAIRPKTARFKAGFVSSQAISGAALTNSSHHIPKPDSKPSLVYKPTAKLVSNTTVSLLANMGNCSTSHQHPQLENFSTSLSSNIHQSNTPRTETNKITEPSKVVSQAQNLEEDQKTLPSPSYGDRPSYDGYNWRKYGQKHVKGSEYPRSYYKCTHPNCPVKKKVERSFDGQIAEIVYKDEHSHSRTQPPKRNSAGTQGSGICQYSNNNSWSNQHGERNEVRIENQNDKALQLNDSGGGGSPENSCGQSGECEEGSKRFDAEEDEPRSKRRKHENQSNETAVPEERVEPRVVVPSSADSEIPEDGFRWRKYGQKAVKGNPYPRSYYRCTDIKCKVRKHVERAIDDPRTFITTYEGKHNHEMPLRIT